MNDALLQYNQIIDEEIDAYKALEVLYQEKQDILVKGDNDALWNIDSQIIDNAKLIKNIEEKRFQTAGLLGDERITLSQVIEKAESLDKELAEKFREQKETLNSLVESLSKKQKTHMSLIEHSLKITNKTIDIIMSVAAPQGSQYDKNGNSNKMEETTISSIIEEV